MLKLIPSATRALKPLITGEQHFIRVRTFLSQAYYCNEVWEHRLRSPILERVKLDDLYQELDNRFNKTKTISAVDVDVFANAVQDDTYVDELLDIVHKLRMTAATGDTLKSTGHAVVRYLTAHGRHSELLDALDDRLNYGLFLDYYTANILMDTYYKNKDFVSGARIASQLMYQEDFNHPLSNALSLLHCYKFLLTPTGWPEYPKPEEPEEEVKIRVKYLRNPHYDDHFDIKDPVKIIGKTTWMVTKNSEENLDKSFHLVGLALHEKTEQASRFIEILTNNNEKIYGDILNLLPEDNEIRRDAAKLQTVSADVLELLEDRVRQAERHSSEKDIALQCTLFSKWEVERKEVLEKELQLLTAQKRLDNVNVLRQQLKDQETKLWFFENEEAIELQIEVTKTLDTVKQADKAKVASKNEEEYIPPEIK